MPQAMIQLSIRVTEAEHRMLAVYMDRNHCNMNDAIRQLINSTAKQTPATTKKGD